MVASANSPRATSLATFAPGRRKQNFQLWPVTRQQRALATIWPASPLSVFPSPGRRAPPPSGSRCSFSHPGQRITSRPAFVHCVLLSGETTSSPSFLCLQQCGSKKCVPSSFQGLIGRRPRTPEGAAVQRLPGAPWLLNMSSHSPVVRNLLPRGPSATGVFPNHYGSAHGDECWQ